MHENNVNIAITKMIDSARLKCLKLHVVSKGLAVEVTDHIGFHSVSKTSYLLTLKAIMSSIVHV